MFIFIYFQSTNTDKVCAERTEITDTSIIVTKAKPAKRQISLKKLVKSFSRVRYSLEKKTINLKIFHRKQRSSASTLNHSIAVCESETSNEAHSWIRLLSFIFIIYSNS
jgi:hypothetical protein